MLHPEKPGRFSAYGDWEYADWDSGIEIFALRLKASLDWLGDNPAFKDLFSDDFAKGYKDLFPLEFEMFSRYSEMIGPIRVPDDVVSKRAMFEGLWDGFDEIVRPIWSRELGNAAFDKSAAGNLGDALLSRVSIRDLGALAGRAVSPWIEEVSPYELFDTYGDISDLASPEYVLLSHETWTVQRFAEMQAISPSNFNFLSSFRITESDWYRSIYENRR